MLLIRPSYEILNLELQDIVLRFLEHVGRICYKSEDRITDDSAEKFVQMLLHSQHESVIEHYQFSVKFIIDRGVSHELVRHRLGAYSQESTRYCNYAKKGVTFVIPPWINLPPGICEVFTGQMVRVNNIVEDVDMLTWSWALALQEDERRYIAMLDDGWTPQQARSILPNSLKTEIVATYNLRQWRHVLRMRTSTKAHPQMREVAVPLLNELKQSHSVLFGDINN